MHHGKPDSGIQLRRSIQKFCQSSAKMDATNYRTQIALGKQYSVVQGLDGNWKWSIEFDGPQPRADRPLSRQASARLIGSRSEEKRLVAPGRRSGLLAEADSWSDRAKRGGLRRPSRPPRLRDPAALL